MCLNIALWNDCMIVFSLWPCRILKLVASFTYIEFVVVSDARTIALLFDYGAICIVHLNNLTMYSPWLLFYKIEALQIENYEEISTLLNLLTANLSAQESAKGLWSIQIAYINMKWWWSWNADLLHRVCVCVCVCLRFSVSESIYDAVFF